MEKQYAMDYLRRLKIEFDDSFTPTLDFLNRLHYQHIIEIPFENFDVFSPQGVNLTPNHLVKKIIYSNRGGYCYELNEIFSNLLIFLGYKVQKHLARVWLGGLQVIPAPTHQLSTVLIDNICYLIDVGFGGDGILLPLDLSITGEQRQFDHRFHCYHDSKFGHILEYKKEGIWKRLYSFTDQVAFEKEYQIVNFYVSKHPDSKFTQEVICAKRNDKNKVVLHNNQLKKKENGNKSVSYLSSYQEYKGCLQKEFGMTLDDNDLLLSKLNTYFDAE